MKHVIIDTNVPVKATNTHPEDETDRKCSYACYQYIDRLLRSKDKIVLDMGWEILKEYQKNIRFGYGDNVATIFLKMILREINLQNGRVEQYKITKDRKNSYKEYPKTQKLKRFDPSDRKFVALSRAHPSHPPIVNGSDTDWWIYKEVLNSEGIEIVFLCEEYMNAKCKSKIKI